MNFLKLILLPTVILLSAISHGANYENVDQFKQSKHYESGDWGGFKGENELEGGLFLSLVPGKTILKDNTTKYQLKIRWTGPELLLINHAQLILLIDGERIILDPSKTYSQHLIDTEITSDNNDVFERVDYDVEKQLLAKIAAAKKVECALYSPKGRVERYLHKKNKKQFIEFLKKY
ncbi:MAG: hypothetical protein AAF304_08705 [Pseudomonadota bacterium]